MADVINYTNYFNRLKPLVYYFYTFETLQTSTGGALLTAKANIADPFETQVLTSEISTLDTAFENAITAYTKLKDSAVKWVENVLADMGLELNTRTTDAATVLEALAEAMNKDGETIPYRPMIVHASDVDADTTIKAHASNTGSGKLVYTFALVDTLTNMTNSEICYQEIMQCVCTGVGTARAEMFRISGAKANGRTSHLGQGSGTGPSLQVIGTNLTDGEFEDWSDSPAALDSWTIVTGAWGTDMSQSATSPYEGTYSITGVNAWQITQAISLTLAADAMYVVGLWAKKAAGATGHIYIEIVDSSNVQVVTDELDIDISTLTTDWVFHYATIKMPKAVRTGWKISIRVASPTTAAHFIDNLQFGKMTMHNSLYFALFAGATDFGLGDKFGYGSDNTGFSVEPSSDGMYQRFFGRCFDRQLPSAAVSSIADPTY